MNLRESQTVSSRGQRRWESGRIGESHAGQRPRDSAQNEERKSRAGNVIRSWFRREGEGGGWLDYQMMQILGRAEQSVGPPGGSSVSKVLCTRFAPFAQCILLSATFIGDIIFSLGKNHSSNVKLVFNNCAIMWKRKLITLLLGGAKIICSESVVLALKLSWLIRTFVHDFFPCLIDRLCALSYDWKIA